MTTRAAILLGIVLGSLALTTALGATLTDGKAHGPLSLGDVLVPAATPVLRVIAATAASHIRSAQRGEGMSITADTRPRLHRPTRTRGRWTPREANTDSDSDGRHPTKRAATRTAALVAPDGTAGQYGDVYW